MLTEALSTIPPAPHGGKGGYTSEGELKKDIDLARRVMNSPRWPISDTLRHDVIEWLELVIKTSDDDRARVNALRTLIAADKLNLAYSRLLLDCEKHAKPQEMNLNVTGTVEHNFSLNVFSRIEELQKAFAASVERVG